MEENTNQNVNQDDGGKWRSELPEAMRGHEAFAPYKTKSELWEGHVKLHTEHNAAVQKATDMEGKLKNYIPRLPDNASEEDRNTYYAALGRPEKSDGYELTGDGKSAPEWNNYWKGEFYKLGLSKDQAKGLSGVFDAKMAEIVKIHNETIQKDIKDAGEKLKGELGDKYDASVELANRLWVKHGDGEFDKMFTGETSGTRYAMIKFLLNIAKLTGEDVSPTGAPGQRKSAGGSDAWFPNSPPSPTGR